MKQVEFFFAYLPDPLKPGKTNLSRWRMSREDIASRGGTPDERTRIVREVPETDEEKMQALYGAPVKPAP